jgi:hypothetical protein
MSMNKHSQVTKISSFSTFTSWYKSQILKRTSPYPAKACKNIIIYFYDDEVTRASFHA